MATLGIAYVLEGIGQTLFGSEIYKIDVGMPKDPVSRCWRRLRRRHPDQQGGFLRGIDRRRSGGPAGALLPENSTGRAPARAVADDHQAALSIGIPPNRIWVIVWCVAGVVALAAGIIWGSRNSGSSFAGDGRLRRCRCVILGGLTSVPGRDLGGLIIGAGEKLSEVFVGPDVGGGIEIWFCLHAGSSFLPCCSGLKACLARRSSTACNSREAP